MAIKNGDWIRANMDPRVYEALHDLEQRHNTLLQQVNGNSTGQPQPPPAINSLKVTANDGHFSAAITDNGGIYRGVQYYLEHADNPQFTNPHVIHLGDTRNWTGFLGNTTRYFRAYSSYSSSAPSAPVYHGPSEDPQAVVGGGTIPGAAFLPAEGSGTGPAAVGLEGPGQIPFRSSDGVPPVR